jgi:hypothetical protein
MDRGASWLDLTACRLSLIYEPTEANIPILPVAFRNNPKGGRPHPHAFDRTVTVAPISALSMHL